MRVLLVDSCCPLPTVLYTCTRSGSGLIDEGEFFRALAALGIEVEREEAHELWSTFDADGSGAIDFHELNRLLRKRVVRRDKGGAAGGGRSNGASPRQLMPPGPSRSGLGAALFEPLHSPRGVCSSAREWEHDAAAADDTATGARDVAQHCGFLTASLQPSYGGLQYAPTKLPLPLELLNNFPLRAPYMFEARPDIAALSQMWLQPQPGGNWRTRGPHASPRLQLPRPRMPSLRPAAKVSPRTKLHPLGA